MRRMLILVGLAVGLVAGDSWGLRGSGEAKQVLLRVVDARTGEPVERAEVRFLDPDAWGTPRPLHGLRLMHGPSSVRAHRTDRVDELGSLRRTGEKGELHLPEFEAVAYVSASFDGLYDFTTIRAGVEGPVVLELVPDVTVRVRILDHQGNPCPGVPVSIRQYDEPRSPGSMGGGVVVQGGSGGGGKVTTVNMGGGGSASRTLAGIDSAGPEGIAEFRHVQEVLGEPKEGRRHVVAIASLLAKPIEAELRSDAWPEAPLELQLPETGEIEVVVLDLTDEPLLDNELTISLTKAPERSAKGPGGRMFSAGWRSFEQKVWALEGRAWFRFVEVGVDFEVIAGREWLSSPLDGNGKGPTKAGERVSLRLTCPVLDTRLRGRVIDEEGRVFASKEITFATEFRWRGNGPSGYSTFHTDEKGYFDVLIGPGTAKGWDYFELQLLHVDHQVGTKVESKRFKFTEPLTPGFKLLGAVTLVPPPLLVSGVVVDGGGHPLPGVSLMAEIKQFTGRATNEPGKERPFFWRPSNLSAWTGSEGQFEIRGELEGDELRLNCSRPGAEEDDTLVVSRGDTDVRFVVQQ